MVAVPVLFLRRQFIPNVRMSGGQLNAVAYTKRESVGWNQLTSL